MSGQNVTNVVISGYEIIFCSIRIVNEAKVHRLTLLESELIVGCVTAFLAINSKTVGRRARIRQV